MKNLYTVLTLILLFSVQFVNAQISFTERNDLLMDPNFNSGGPIGVVDVNDDGRDDIVRMDQGYILNFELQNGTEIPFTNQFIGNLNNVGNWSMCAADIHNNGFLSVWADGALAESDENGENFNIYNLEQSSFFVQGSNFVDINNDGWLDAFACNDDGESGIWRNDGSGNLVPQNDWIDMSVNGSSGEQASGNYGSIWTDFDNDGDIDLYIAKCRQGVTNPEDPRRINVLYVNDGMGNFTEMGEEHGLRIGWQSWTADFQDINNDGWLDAFILNHDYQAQIMLNDGTGHFTELENTGINVGGFPIQGVLRDFDNDGFVDAIVTGSNAQIFKNNGDLTFTEIQNPFPNSNGVLSFGCGDLNSDGFVDVYTGYGNGFVSPSNTSDVLHMNDGNDNNHLSVHLRGVVSNRDGLGAKIEIYGEWGMQVREVRSGESYGIMNSMNQYFGLGTATEIDSMIIRWPSGFTQAEYDLQVNSFVEIIEGGCLAASPSVMINGPDTFCSGDSTELRGQDGYSSYTWSTGDTTQNIIVTEAGNYRLTVTDESDCFGFSASTSIVVDPILNPSIIAEGDLVICEGESVILTEIGAADTLTYTWSTGETGNSIEVTQSGTYTVGVAGLCNDFQSNSISVLVDQYPDAPIADPVTILEGEQAFLTATGTNIAWYETEQSGDVLAVGENYTTPILTETTTYFAESRTGLIGTKEEVGMNNHFGSLYSGDQNGNNLLSFDAFEPFILDSVKVYTDTEAIRKIVVYDENSNLVASKEVLIPFGENVIALGLEIPQGNNLSITTDAEVNQTSLGIQGPRLQRSDQNVSFPYVVDGIVSINESNFGVFWYYYFYDWKISTPSHICASERTPVEVTVDNDVATYDIFNSNLVSAFPNPTTGQMVVDLNIDTNENLTLDLLNLQGQLMTKIKLDNKRTYLDLSQYPKGVYTFSIVIKNDIYQGRVIVQ